MMMCFCDLCEFSRLLGVPPDHDFSLKLGGEIISAYMRQHNASFPEAVEAIERMCRLSMAEFVATYGRIHGLDETHSWDQIVAHGVNPPLWLQ